MKKKVPLMKTGDKTKIKLIALDKHPIILSGYSEVFSRTSDVVLVQTFTATNLLLEYRPAEDIDFVLIGNNDESCLNTGKFCYEKYPDVRLILSTEETDPVFFRECLKVGFRGFIARAEPPELIVNQIRNLLREALVISERFMVGLQNEIKDALLYIQYTRLSKKERKLLPYLAQGLSHMEIAASFKVKRETVSKHAQNIRLKIQGLELDEIYYRLRLFLRDENENLL